MTGGGPIDESKRATLRRFAALGVAGPLARTAGDESQSETPEAIRGYLKRTPGAHFSKVRDDLQLGTGEAQHHLRALFEAGRIERQKDGEYRRYYPADQFDTRAKVTLGYLRRGTPRGMLIGLLRDPDRSAGALASALDVAPSTISKHAGSLAEAGIITVDDGYRLRDPTLVVTLLVRYADSFGPAAVALADDATDLLTYDR
jgi:predicted transcriptional regulator